MLALEVGSIARRDRTEVWNVDYGLGILFPLRNAVSSGTSDSK